MATRSEMEARLIEAGVAKWGEAERGGVTRLVRAKSLKTLQIEFDLLTLAGSGEKAVRDHVTGMAGAARVASHCNDSGVS
jgi:hypothetical protein